MKKYEQLYKPSDFASITKVELYDLWFRQALTEKQIAMLFGVTAQEVKEKRKALNIKWLNSGIASVAGTVEFRNNYKKIVRVDPPENWNGEPIEFIGYNKDNKKMTSEELLDAIAEVKGSKEDKGKYTSSSSEQSNQNQESKAYTDKADNLEDASEVWQRAKENEEQQGVVKIDTDEIVNEVIESMQEE